MAQCAKERKRSIGYGCESEREGKGETEWETFFLYLPLWANDLF
jgi:hypothetical protein